MKNYLLFALLFLPMFLLGQAKEANLLGTWNDSTLVGSTIHTNVYNEIWGYAIADHEYAIIGSTAGTHFIEVTDPSQPTEVFFVPGAAQGGIIIHRDYHDYQGYLYAVADEGNSTLQIIDLQQLPDTVTVVYDSREFISRSHNIFIDTTNAILYSLLSRGGITNFSAMTLFDISDPIAPTYIGEFNQFGGIRASQVHDAFVRDNIAFLNLGPDGLAIVDFTVPTAPVTLSTITDYQDRGYNHSGWLTDDCGHYYMADENHGFDMKAIDVNNLCEPEIKSTFNASVTAPTSIPHNQLVACDYLYTAYYYDGLRIYDISDPVTPELVLFYDTYSPPDGTQFRGAWGVYPFLPSGTILLSDMQSGLFVFEGMGDNCASQEKPFCALENCLQTVTQEISEIDQLQLQPNPVVDQFWLSVKLSTALSSLNISLSTISGQVVQTWQVQNLQTGTNELSFSFDKELSGGLYFLSLHSEKEMTIRKLLIK